MLLLFKEIQCRLGAELVDLFKLRRVSHSVQPALSLKHRFIISIAAKVWVRAEDWPRSIAASPLRALHCHLDLVLRAHAGLKSQRGQNNCTAAQQRET